MKPLIIIILFITSLFSFASTNVNAEDSGERVPYSVRAILPQNQVDKTVSYFDIEMEPGSSQSLNVEVFNSSNEEITVLVDTNFGATNPNGIITYDGSIEEYDESMEVLFNDITRIYEEEMTIPAGESEQAIIDVEIPEEGFNGQILGGIFFRLESDEETEEDAAFGFINEYAYVIGVNIVQSQSEDEADNEEDTLSVDEIDPILELNEVNAELINYRTGVNAEFANKTPVLIDNLLFEAHITEADDEEVLYERTVDEFSIGPNNLFEFPIDFENQPLEPGEYTYHAVVENEDDSWEFSQNFSITEEQSIEINESAAEIDEGWNWSYIIIGVAAFILTLILIILLLLTKLRTKQ